MGGKPTSQGPSAAEQRAEAEQSWGNYSKWKLDVTSSYERASASNRARALGSGSTGASTAIQKKLDADYKQDMADIEGGATARYLKDYHGQQQAVAQAEIDAEYADDDEGPQRLRYDEEADSYSKYVGIDGDDDTSTGYAEIDKAEFDKLSGPAPKADIGSLESYYNKEFGKGSASERAEDTAAGKATARAKASGGGRASAAKAAQAEGSAWSVSTGTRTKSPWS